jgi:Tfp pilus assembly protein PilF
MVKRPVWEGTKLSRKLIIILVLLIVSSGCNSKTKEELCAEGKKQLDVGNANAATVLLKNALEKDPNYIDARYELARAYMGAKNMSRLSMSCRRSPVKTLPL